jgi:hypothetical protein
MEDLSIPMLVALAILVMTVVTACCGQMSVRNVYMSLPQMLECLREFGQ